MKKKRVSSRTFFYIQPYSLSLYLTFLVGLEAFTHPHTHVVESQEILGQRVIVLLIKSRQTPERLPLETLAVAVSLDAKGRHDAVEVGLLASRPPLLGVAFHLLPLPDGEVEPLLPLQAL